MPELVLVGLVVAEGVPEPLVGAEPVLFGVVLVVLEPIGIPEPVLPEGLVVAEPVPDPVVAEPELALTPLTVWVTGEVRLCAVVLGVLEPLLAEPLVVPELVLVGLVVAELVPEPLVVVGAVLADCTAVLELVPGGLVAPGPVGVPAAVPTVVLTLLVAGARPFVVAVVAAVVALPSKVEALAVVANTAEAIAITSASLQNKAIARRALRRPCRCNPKRPIPAATSSRSPPGRPPGFFSDNAEVKHTLRAAASTDLSKKHPGVLMCVFLLCVVETAQYAAKVSGGCGPHPCSD